MLSPNGLFMLHQSLYPSKTFQYNSQGQVVFIWVILKHGVTSGPHFLQGIPIGAPFFKTTLFIFKTFTVFRLQ